MERDMGAFVEAGEYISRYTSIDCWGRLENRRTFTSVGNICFAANGVLTKDLQLGIYNMGDDEALSTSELIEEICKSHGKKTHIW